MATIYCIFGAIHTLLAMLDVSDPPVMINEEPLSLMIYPFLCWVLGAIYGAMLATPLFMAYTLGHAVWRLTHADD